jgi:hypothetical protein
VKENFNNKSSFRSCDQAFLRVKLKRLIIFKLKVNKIMLPQTDTPQKQRERADSISYVPDSLKLLDKMEEL